MKYSFSDCMLDTERRELFRHGRPVRLRPKVFQVLTYLVENADRVISKEELFQKLWTGRVVGDATLNSCIKEVRRAVGDSGGSQGILRTFHGQGYRFVARVFETVETPHTGDDHVEAPVGDSVEETGVAAGRPVRDGREYKPVSVLTVALDDASRLAREIGPEAMDELLRALFDVARNIVGRFGGTVTEWLDDGFTALFGAPVAVEDHARCAALASLALVRELKTKRGLAQAEINAGLHSGRVLVGSLDQNGPLFTAVGDTTRTARQLKDQAKGEVLASAEFFALIESEFEGERADDGAFRVTALAREASGVPQRGGRYLSPFVGRDQELQMLTQRLDLAAGGAGQAIGISGEPGIGKSRLAIEFQRIAAGRDVTILGAHCLPYRRATPYFPLLRLVSECCKLADQDDAEEIRSALGAACAQAGITDGNDVELLLELLDAGSGERAILDQEQSRVFDLVSRLILEASRERTCIVIIEDLHWMDATSGDWLSRFVTRIDRARVLLLATYRPGYRGAWTGHSAVSQISLPRLTDHDSAKLVVSLAARLHASPGLRRSIVSNAQGNPFFLEELTWSLAKTKGEAEKRVPTTVQAVLAARIDQLEPADKTLLQTAAVIGTPIPEALLRVVAGGDGLEASLRRLENGEFLYREDSREGTHLRFKHALTRDVAYESLLTTTRRELHRRIAKLYETRFETIAERHPELVARHYTEAGVSRKAFDYWRAAGRDATRRSANPEAVLHFTEALKVAEALPEDDERRREELRVHLELGPPLMASEGFSAPPVGESYRRALALSDAVGTSRERFPVLWGLWLHHTHRGILEESRKLSGEILELADELDESEFRLQAHHAAWTNALWHDPDVGVSRVHALAGVDIYDQELHHVHAYRYGGHDPGVCARSTAGIASWFAGLPDQALELIRSGAQLADRTGHPYSRIITRNDFILIHSLRGEPARTRAVARETLALCEDLSIPNYLAESKIFLGLSQALLGDDADTNLALVAEGLEEYRAVGAQRNLGYCLLFLAETCLMLKRYDAGLHPVAEAKRLTQATGEVRWSGEIARIEGELLKAGGRAADQVEGLFRSALDASREQNARAFELRAATSLGRLWVEENRRAQARALLEPVLAQFNEGLDTRDLREASALLDSLR